ncbi:MAG: hypothetical protein HC886_22595 [Leptolyngbyaceae cyanobacterium SM1_1_3]|nr:hypothetical protein [Leptolyngbyaceae cyanobacterium SM1_1_3]NJN02550.1 hypothetical protein [Leptolyngbyaceae cyanobacterium RM1_1_2]NJO08568.1 hypothetical protein [Leptolyngbyaceae cyanobacterium SL_1_1]
MKLSDQKNEFFEQFTERLPPHILASFSEAQLGAMREALKTRAWRQHSVDLRLSLPLLWKRFYVVLVAGPERRIPGRRTAPLLWTPGNLLVMFLVSLAGVLILSGFLHLSSVSLAPLLKQDAAPVGIPFKRDRASCEKSGRIWQEDQCIDYEHDPTF